jgi:hypothetical protein
MRRGRGLGASEVSRSLPVAQSSCNFRSNVQNAQGLGLRVLATEEDLRLVFLKGDM